MSGYCKRPRALDRLSSVGLVALAVAALHATPVAAQAGRADEPADGEIVVTANKRIERLSEVGGAISAIGGNELRELGADKIQDYLLFVPGVSLTSYGRPGQTELSIRGIASQSVGPAAAVYVDEIPFGQSSNEGQGSAYVPDLDPSDLERVEVLKGPQGTLYGASSLGGLLKYVTRLPSLTETELETGIEVEAIEGGDVGYKLRAGGTTPLIRDQLGLRLSGYYRRDAGFVDNVTLGKKDVNEVEAWGIRGALLFQPVDPLRIKLSAMLQNTRGEGMNEVDYARTFPPFTPVYGDLRNSRYIDQPSQVNNRVFSAEISYDFGSVSLLSASGLTRQNIDRVLDVTRSYGLRYPALGTVPGAGNTIALNAGYDVRKFTQEVRLQSSSNRKFEWVVGFFYQNERSDNLSEAFTRNAAGVLYPDPVGRPVTTASQNLLKEYAGFANATLYLAPSFDLTAGYRHARIEQTNDKLTAGLLYTPATPSLITTRTDIVEDDIDTFSFAARWRLSPQVLLYARAASGYRPGGGRTLPPAAEAAGLSPTYGPDEVWSYEVGVKARAFDNRLSFNLNGFWIDWTNIQTFANIGGFLVQGNAGSARSRGIEAEVSANPFEGLGLAASFGYTDAIFTEDNAAGGVVAGDPLSSIAKYTASARGKYEYSFGGDWQGFVGGDAAYRSDQMDQVGIMLPGYTLFGIDLGVQNDSLRISLYIDNLTDKRGLLGTSIGIPRPTVPYSWAVVQPRTFGVNLSKRW